MVVYTVSYAFSNMGSGFNSTNYSTGTVYLNNIKSNTITSNNITSSNLTINNNLNLSNGTTLPTTGQLGERINGTSPGIVAFTSSTSGVSILVLTPGTWMINGQVSFQSNAAVAIAIQCYMVSIAKAGSTAGMAQDIKFGNGNMRIFYKAK